MYNVECWSMDAMKREVADTPGPFAMAGGRFFPLRTVRY